MKNYYCRYTKITIVLQKNIQVAKKKVKNFFCCKHRENTITNFGKLNQILIVTSYTFPIDLAPNEIEFGAKSFRKV